MNKYSPEIISLRQDIEKEVRRQIKTPYDFEFLSGVIWERLPREGLILSVLFAIL